MRKLFLFLHVLLLTQASTAAQTQNISSKLVEKPVPDLGQVTLTYDPALARDHAVTADERTEIDKIDCCVFTYALDIKISRSGKYFVVLCGSGASDDFFCAFKPFDGPAKSLDNPEEYGTQIDGMRFEIPGDGCVYVAGHNNTMFNLRRKFCLDGDRLKEIEQPFHFVGLKSKTKENLTLYRDRDKKQVVGTIAKGDFVEILIANIVRSDRGLPSHDDVLVRDERGLRGWVDVGAAENIEGFFFAGD